VIHCFDLCAERVYDGHDRRGDKAQALINVNRRQNTLYSSLPGFSQQVFTACAAARYRRWCRRND
jgi:hypothetical protein